MPLAGIVTIALAGVLVAALAAYLIAIVVILRSVHDTLGKVTFGVRAIAHRTTPVNETVQTVNDDLRDVAEALEGLVAELNPPAVSNTGGTP